MPLLVLLISAAILWFAIKLIRDQAREQAPVQLRQIELIDKVTTMLASKDVMAFQGIQAMSMSSHPAFESYDPSDEAEARREAERHGTELDDGSGDYEDLLSALG